MRIIKLGNIDAQFCCRNCHTIWEINTEEIKKDEKGNYFTVCPLCDMEIIMSGDYEFVKFLHKRQKFQKEKNNE